MIKENEFRIGNYVFLEGHITDISRSDFEYCNDQIAQPIPLTPDILLKSGFIKIGVDMNDNDIYRIQATYRKFTLLHIGHFYYDQTPIVSFHHLQNLFFALCGEDLKINI